jgi:hypothetical protein
MGPPVRQPIEADFGAADGEEDRGAGMWQPG